MTVRVERELVTELISSVVVSVDFVGCGTSDDDDVLVEVVCSVEGAAVDTGVGEGERERVLEYGSMLIIIVSFVFFFFDECGGLSKEGEL